MMNCGCNQNVYQIPANCSRATPNKTLLLNALAALVTGNEASTFKSELQSDCHTAESSTLSRKSCPQQCNSFFNFITLHCIMGWRCASYWCHLKGLLGIEVQNVHTLITCRHLERQTCWVSWQCFDLELQNVREKQKIRANNLCVICVIICIAIVPQPWHLRIPQQMNYFDCLSFFSCLRENKDMSQNVKVFILCRVFFFYFNIMCVRLFIT